MIYFYLVLGFILGYFFCSLLVHLKGGLHSPENPPHKETTLFLKKWDL